MTRPEFIAMLQPLVSAFRVDMDMPAWSAYFRALEDVPLRLLEAAVSRCLKSGGAFLPKPGELRQMAEEARMALLSAHPFHPCECCSAQGWTEQVMGGVRRMVRCACWHAHQQRIAQLGVGSAPLMLPAADVWYEPTSGGYAMRAEDAVMEQR